MPICRLFLLPAAYRLLLPTDLQSINVDVNHSVFEVQEEFAIGLGGVVQARAAEKARMRPLPVLPLLHRSAGHVKGGPE